LAKILFERKNQAFRNLPVLAIRFAFDPHQAQAECGDSDLCLEGGLGSVDQ